MSILNMVAMGSGGGANIGEPSSISATASANSVTVTWNDNDLNTIPQSTFQKSVLVRKVGSAPTSPSDGTLVVTETVKNTYSSSGYTDTGLTEGTTYYYQVFSYSDTGGITYGTPVSVITEADRPDLDQYSQTYQVNKPSSGMSEPHALCVSPDGKYLYITSTYNNALLRSFYLSDGSLNTYTGTWRTTTINYISSRGMFYKDERTILSLTDANNGFYEVFMTADNNLSNATITSLPEAFSDTATVGCEFNEDGTYFYRSVAGQGKIRQYSLSTPYSLASGSLTQLYELDISGVMTSPYDIRISPSGKKMFISRRETGIGGVYQWNLSTAWDVSTASYSGKSITGLDQTTFDVTEDGRIFMYTWDGKIRQYDAS